MFKPFVILLAFLLQIRPVSAQQTSGTIAKGPAVIGYYAGRNTVDSFDMSKLTHVIFSFCHLKENRLNVDRAIDSTTIQQLVALKTKYPELKVILSLGGWGGCKTCPDVFFTRKGRRAFVSSVKVLNEYFHTDGIDLDWEYPSMANVPGYTYYPQDKDNFTALIKLLRKKMGRNYHISFAAGGLTKHLENSIDWKKIIRYVDYVNLMSYDLVSGYDTVSGHHTPLFSTPEQPESTDHAIHWLDSAGVPLSKIAIGAAFYARIFNGVDSINNGLYRPCRFWRGVSYRDQARYLSPDSGYQFHWDPIAQAPWLYNPTQKLFVSYDDSMSIHLKTIYTLEKKLGGIMFWQLAEDKFSNGLLDVIDNTKRTWLNDPKNKY